MASLVCDRCDARFASDTTFMTAEVTVISKGTREVLEQVFFCEACASAVDDCLSLETVFHE
jgi:hypothetical protein